MLIFFSGEKKDFSNLMDALGFLWRKIGSVNIFELSGKVAQPWADQLGEDMKNALTVHPGKGLLMNFLQVEEEDNFGARVVLEALDRSEKPGLLLHDHCDCLVLRHIRDIRDRSAASIPIFKNTYEAVNYFEKEFIVEEFVERRRYPRIKAALPVQFRLVDGNTILRFEAVVTNVSLGGVFAQFLDSHTEALVKEKLDPFDLRLLHMELKLPKGEAAEGEGKVLRLENDAMVVEFYKLSDKNKEKLTTFLNHFTDSQKLEKKL